jgi:hypothetical protein
MYNSFFGFDVDPFRVNPDPRFLYFSESHREALATLVYAVRERKGFIVLTGEVGTGKTTVVNALLQKLERNVQSAYLFNTALSLEDFFAYLFEELGLEHVTPFQKATTLHRLNHHLIERLRNGHSRPSCSRKSACSRIWRRRNRSCSRSSWLDSPSLPISCRNPSCGSSASASSSGTRFARSPLARRPSTSASA